MVGLAVGFGAQALVRDVIAGIFFLAEDVFRVGEYIESGSTTKGTVERITLRTVALRHHNGPLYFGNTTLTRIGLIASGLEAACGNVSATLEFRKAAGC